MSTPLVIDETLPSHTYLELLDDPMFTSVFLPEEQKAEQPTPSKVNFFERFSDWFSNKENVISK